MTNKALYRKAGICLECGKDIRLGYTYCYKHRHLKPADSDKTYGKGHNHSYLNKMEDD